MFSYRRRLLLTASASAALLSACGGGGSSSSAPTSVTAIAGDNQIFVSWDVVPGVDYWLWFKEGTTVAPGDKTAGYKLTIDSPYILNEVKSATALSNDVSYAISINGRVNGGAGGPGSTAVTATPRPGGADWNTGNALGSTAMRGIAYGRSIGSTSYLSYVAVGDGGAIYNTPDTTADRIYRSTSKLNWIQPTGTGVASSIDLKGVVYASGLGNYYAVGSNGTVAYSSDINNWTTLTSAATGTTNTFNAVASSGSTLVAVGDNGVIRYSTDGTTWSTPGAISEDISAINLRGVTYLSNTGVWVAVGSNGKVLTSTSVGTWTVATQSGDLTGVASGYRLVDSTYTYYYVAVGADGTVLTSNDATTWTTQVLGGAFNTAAVGTRLVAMGSGGAIYTRELDGSTWTARTSSLPGSAIYGIIRAQGIYTAVGAGGATIYSY